MYYSYLIIDARSSDTRSVSEAAPIRKERASMTEFGEKRKTQGHVCMSKQDHSITNRDFSNLSII